MLQRRQCAATAQYMYFKRLQVRYILKSSIKLFSRGTSTP
jgi:hypothetical protein